MKIPCFSLRILIKNAFLSLATATLGSIQANAVTVQYGTFISSPQHFNGFEGIGASLFPGYTHSEGGITATYVGAFQPSRRLADPGYETDGVWASWTNQIGGQGNYGWYGPGTGYTSIKLTSGANMQDIQFLAGSGWGHATTYLQYELLDDGALIASGAIAIVTGNWSTGGWARGEGPSSSDPAMSYFGFSGGGFDEVRLQNRGYPETVFGPTSFEAGAYDSFAATVENSTTVPERSPTAPLLLAAGLFVVVLRCMRRQVRRF